MKYLILKIDNLRTPVLFSDDLNHKDVAYKIGGEVCSAGFVSISIEIDGLKIKTYGYSHSLDLVSKPDDRLIIKAHLKGKV